MKNRLLVSSLVIALLLLVTGIVWAQGSTPLPRADAPTEKNVAPQAFCDNVTEIPIAECEALVALYNSTDGANWEDNTGWLETTTPCDWYGVECSSGHVDNLRLSNNQLSGNIPAELGNLTKLEDLDLRYNQLSGSIPAELGNLTNLTSLELYNNQLSGSIPAELGNLGNLEYISLGYNQLSSNIPAELGNLTKLTNLRLQGNQLSDSIPAELGNLNNLEILYLSSNQLNSSIPAELGNLTNLISLALCYNQLSGNIPAELGNLTKLEDLDLRYNQLSGSIPVELGNLSNLPDLQLHDNQLSGSIPAELGNLTNLTSLELYNNQLSGSIPTELGDLINLEGIFLEHNQLSSNIPAELGNLTKLTNLRLQDNQLSGSIPAELGNLNNLEILYLSSNQLNSSIPVELGNLTKLTKLSLGNNQLSGSIPVELGNLGNLEDINLENNQLSGSIPAELANLTKLTDLWLRDNQLSGSIPVELGNLGNLENINLENNQLSGSIPAELGNLTKLTDLWLRDNQLSGSIPAELSNLTNLEDLILGNNQLSGEIPTWLGNLTSLDSIELHENQLGGNIPSELGNLANLESLHLDDNQLIGDIPILLTNLSNLKYLDLGENQLSGSIPVELGNLTNLISFSLHDNPLSGELPASLTNLNLEYFYFENTDLCEPGDAAFQAWLDGITNLGRTGIICGEPTPAVTSTPTATPSATPTDIPTSNYTITGQVTDGLNPISDITITLGIAYTVTTDSHGNYAFSDLPGGTYTLTPHGTRASCIFGPPTHIVTVPPAATHIDFVTNLQCVNPPGAVAGTITEQGTSTAVANARVSVAGQVAYSDSAGSYTITDVPIGSYTLRVSADGYKNYNTVVTISEEEQTTRDISLPPIVPEGYRLPFPGGKKYQCTQGNNGSYSHRGRTKYAFDWGIAVGRNVVAARAGKVVAVKENSSRGGCSSAYKNYGNYVKIRHKDGSETLYYHLRKNSVPVRVGQRVQSGQVIGKVGLTGWVCGAHLHFERRPAGRRKSIRTQFLDVTRHNGIPRQGKYYRSGNYLSLSLLGAVEPLQEEDEPPWGAVEFRFTGQPTHTVLVYAFDDLSDNLQMRLGATAEEMPDAAWQPVTDTVAWAADAVWAQYQDSAGNMSDVYSDTTDVVGYGALRADFAVSATVCANAQVLVENQTYPDCAQCGWQWDLGNGTTSVDFEPGSYPDLVAYDASGEYTITLTATGVNYISTISQSLTVIPAPAPEFTIVRAEDTITVTSAVTDAVSWQWDFGDGITATGRVATHTYTDTTWLDEDAVPVQLRLESTNGCTGFGYQYVPQPQRVYLPLVLKE